MDDADCMSRVAEGHLELLAVLFERHHGRLFRFFLRLTRNRERSEDLVQEVFVRILKYRHSFKPRSPFSPWMYQIARRVHLSYLKQQRRDLPIEDVENQLEDGSESPPRRMQRLEDEECLQKALETLPARKRELLVLSRQSDLKYKDLATVFECSLSALKVEVHRAVKDLRKAFLELQGGSA